MTAKAPGSKIKHVLAALGTEYSITVIEGENVIYQKLNDDYEIEISGLDNRKDTFSCIVYLWDIKLVSIKKLAERHEACSLDELKNILESLSKKHRS